MIDPKLNEIIFFFRSCLWNWWILVNTIDHIKSNGEVKTPEDRLTLQQNIRGVELKPLPHMLALTNLILHDIEIPNIIYDDALSKEISSISKKR